MSRRRGFTLIEVMVALTLTALVVFLAHRVTAGLVDGARDLTAAQVAHDDAVNARRLLTALVASLDLDHPQQPGFHGEPDRVTFTAWVRDARGHWRRHRVTLGVERSRLVLSGLGERPLALRDDVRELALDYLLEPGAAARWVRTWHSTASAPLAVRARVVSAEGADTLLLVVGERG